VVITRTTTTNLGVIICACADRVVLHVLCVMWLLGECLAQQPVSSNSEGAHWSRLNWGISRRLGQTSLSYGFVHHTFLLRLPRAENQENITYQCDERCERLGSVPDAIHAIHALRRSVRSSITELILEINEMIPDIMIDGTVAASRRPRGLFNFIGWGMKYIYGSALDSDVELLRIIKSY